jgi:predicted metal-binding membrane protein
MWTLMMTAMMLPSLAPALLRSRVAAAGYFLVWTLAALAVYPLADRISGLAPITTGVLVTLAGLVQFTRWKAKYLACCRGEHGEPRLPAWRHGLRHGMHCVCCCGNLMAMLFVIGAMDLWPMAAVTAAITFERFAGQRAARAVGVLTCAFGVFLLL